jgi:tyrosyl-tRNA synthetase
MSVTDALMIRYYELLSDISTKEFEQLKNNLKSGKAHPKEVKMQLARELVKKYYDEREADTAHKNFTEQFSQKNAAKDRVLIKKPSGDTTWIDYLHASLPDLGVSKSELRRLMTQNAVRFYSKGDLTNEKTLSNPMAKTESLTKGDLIKVGKRTWAEVQ